MMTACHSCSTNAEIARYVVELKKAEETNDPVALESAEKWRKQLVAICKDCKRATIHDDIRIEHSPHNNNHLTPEPIHNEKNVHIANLTEADEDTLRRFIYTLTELDPLEIVATLHLARRGTSRTIATTIENYTKAIRWYKNGKMSRATILFKWKSLIRKMPELAAARSWPKGHNGRTCEK